MRLIYPLCHYNRFFDRGQQFSVRRSNCFGEPKFNSARDHATNNVAEFVNLTVNIESNRTIGFIYHFLALAVVTNFKRGVGSLFIFSENGEGSELRTGGNYAIVKFSVGRVGIGSAIITATVERCIGANCKKAWDSDMFFSIYYKINLFAKLLQKGFSYGKFI